MTGASGMLGEQVLRALLRDGVEAEGWSNNTRRLPGGIRLRPAQYWNYPGADVIVHCAALTDVDALEDADFGQTRQVNALWPEDLARHAASIGARFIHVSTEAVYDGESTRPHPEDEPPHPINVYAKTKCEGEVRVLGAYPEATVIRTTFFGRSLPGKRRKIAEQILDHLAAGEPIELANDQIFTPLYSVALARLILRLAAMEVPGVLNLGSCDAVSIAEFGYMLAEASGLDPAPIRPVALADMPRCARRSRNTALDVQKAQRLLDDMPTVGEGIEEMLAG